MFGLFKKKTKLDSLNDKYQKLQKEAFQLSTVNRAKSDQKQAEAQEILNQIEALEKSGS